jgi:hypothetical protein
MVTAEEIGQVAVFAVKDAGWTEAKPESEPQRQASLSVAAAPVEAR